MKKIAIMVEYSRAYGRSLIEGVAAYAQQNHHWLLRPVFNDKSSCTNLNDYDGIIARIADDRLAKAIQRSGIPAVDVFCQKPQNGLAGVDSDHRKIGEIARKFFKDRGFTNFAYCGLPGTTFSDARQAAYADASTYVYTSSSQPISGHSQVYHERFDRILDAKPLSRWIKSLPKPIAVFCCNDLRAIQLQRIAIDNGLRVPQDLAILGVDDDRIACSFAEVPISSIDPNSFEIGHSAARILAAIMVRKPRLRFHRPHLVKPGEITERASTDFMPIDPPWLGAALMYIESNLRRPIAASEIFALSKRSSTYVENVFKAKLGQPVQAYITSVKMREAKRLLSDPDLRISEIAYLCGFSSHQYFCRTFTATFGMNPTQARAGNRSVRK